MGNKAYIGKKESTTVTTSLTTIATIPCDEGTLAGISIDNNGAAFNAFEIQAQANPDDTTWYTIRDTGTQFTSPTGRMIEVFDDQGNSEDVTVLPDAEEVLITLNVQGLYAVRLQASVASGTTSVDAYWRVGRER